MFKQIGKILSFSLKLLAVAYILALIEDLINKLIRKWRTRGIDPRVLMAEEMEKYYMKHGVQCSSCMCWLPAEADVCPVCLCRIE